MGLMHDLFDGSDAEMIETSEQRLAKIPDGAIVTHRMIEQVLMDEIDELRAENDRLLCELADEQNRVAKLRRAMDEAFPPAHLLALELECLLMDTKDTAAQSKWWEPAHNALEQWREYCRADDDGRQGKTFMGEPVIVTHNAELRGR